MSKSKNHRQAVQSLTCRAVLAQHLAGDQLEAAMVSLREAMRKGPQAWAFQRTEAPMIDDTSPIETSEADARPYVAPAQPALSSGSEFLQQIIYALQRAEATLKAEADTFCDKQDYRAEFPAEDAQRMREAQALLQTQLGHLARMNAPCKCGAGTMADCFTTTCDKVRAALSGQQQAPAPEAQGAEPLKGWKLNHVQYKRGEGTAQIGYLDPEDDRFSPIVTVDTDLYFQPDQAAPLAVAILGALEDAAAHAQQAAPRPLTEAQIKEAVREEGLNFTAPDVRVARAIERAHGISAPTAAPTER